MTKIIEVPGVPTAGQDYRDPNVIKLVSIGDEAMITIDSLTGDYELHPDTLAFGDSERGKLVVPGWRGCMMYQRGVGTAHNDNAGWSWCLGDMICVAIAEGRIPLHSENDLPESYRIPDYRAARAATLDAALRDDPTLELASRLHRAYSNALDGLDDWVGLADMDRAAWRAVAESAQQLLGADFPPHPDR